MSSLTARPATPPTSLWRFTAAVVLAVASVDAVAGIATATAGGTWRPNGAGITGALLLAVALAGHAAAVHAVRTGRTRPLRLCLTVLVAWHASCTTAMIFACTAYGHTLDPGPIVFSALLAAAACWTSRAAPAAMRR
ncbi:hypothetical protein [Actinoplanes sp. NPDC026623]|uniref:hypothetical protein n=1 Tax=Actinoplanes sp. NPDC026623 TaxID=3155610 RepID=UPI0033EFA4D5